MLWEVIGANRETGADQTLHIEANDEASAKRRANRNGLLVATCRPIESNDSLVGLPQVIPHARQNLQPPPLAAQPQQVFIQPPPTYVNVAVMHGGPLTNGWGITSIIFGALSLVISVVPCVGWIAALPFVGLGLIFAIVGVIVGHSHGRPVLSSYIGGGMCLCAVLLGITMMLIIAAAGQNMKPPNSGAPNLAPVFPTRPSKL